MGGHSAYCFKVQVYQSLIKLSLFIKEFSDITLFPDKSSYKFHRMKLKLGGQLDYKQVQGIAIIL